MSSNSDSIADAWLRLWSPTINLPGSGSIGGFNYHPYTTWEAPSLFSGNQAVEAGVYREVASPGRQLGQLTDAVLEIAKALAETNPAILNGDAVKKLSDLRDEVETVKSRIEDSAANRAEKILNELRDNDPDALLRLLDKFGGS